LLDASKPLAGNGLKVYSAALLPEIDLEQLTYFASSIVWRAAVHKWRRTETGVRPPISRFSTSGQLLVKSHARSANVMPRRGAGLTPSRLNFDIVMRAGFMSLSILIATEFGLGK